MQQPEATRPQFYFALPRLLARLGGRSSARAENNWIEANAVGAAILLISYLLLTRLLLSDISRGLQVALLIPMLVATYFIWILILYGNTFVIRLLRAAGTLKSLSAARAQSLLIGITTTAFALHLLTANGWMRLIAQIWLGGVFLNLIAAMILAVMPSSSRDA